MTARNALVAIAVLMLTAATPVVAAGEPISGRELLAHCTDDTGEATVSSACASHFRAALNAMRAGGRVARTAAQCMPEDVSLQSLVARYVSESERFPEVLDVSAQTLIVGMVVKFYHCRPAMWISPMPDLDT